MTTLQCTHTGCEHTVEVSAHFKGALLDRLARAAVCPDHEPEPHEQTPDDEPPTVMSAWQRRVPTPITQFYGRAPMLGDLPPTLSAVQYLRCIAEAWPQRWLPPSGWDSPVNAIAFAGVTGSLKTTTAYALVGEMLRRMDRPDLHHEKIYVGTEGDLLGDTYNERGFANPTRPDLTVRRADIVLIDDVGTAHFASGKNRTNSWWALMDEVSKRSKFLIITTNLADERQLWDHMGAAAFSRLVGMWGRPPAGGFVAPTSDRPSDRGYWPTQMDLLITPTDDDHRMMPAGEQP